MFFSFCPFYFQTTNIFVKEEPIDTDKNGGNKSEATESSESETPLGKHLCLFYLYTFLFFDILLFILIFVFFIFVLFLLCFSVFRHPINTYVLVNPLLVPHSIIFLHVFFIHKVSFISSLAVCWPACLRVPRSLWFYYLS